MDKILEESRNMSTTEIKINDVAQEIIKVAKQIYTDRPEMHPWFRGVDMIKILGHLGKANVRTHLERLTDKNILESKLFGTKNVYRFKILGENED